MWQRGRRDAVVVPLASLAVGIWGTSPGDESADCRRATFRDRFAYPVYRDRFHFGHRRRLLLFAWLQNRRTIALAWWGIGYLLGAAAAALLAAPTLTARALSLGAGNTLLCAAYGLMWAGARSFERPALPLLLVAAGPIMWIFALWFAGTPDSPAACVVSRVRHSRRLLILRRPRAFGQPRIAN